MFYVYMWLREDGRPYYIGKGQRKRGYTSQLHRVKCPCDDERIIVQHYESEAEAFFAEKFFIGLYGRLDLGTGCLANLTEGGEGASGTLVSDETKRKQSAAGKGKTKSKEWRLKIKQSNILAVKMHPRSEQWVERQRASQTGVKRSTWPVGKVHVSFDKGKSLWRSRNSEWRQLGYFLTKEEAEGASPTKIKVRKSKPLGENKCQQIQDQTHVMENL